VIVVAVASAPEGYMRVRGTLKFLLTFIIAVFTLGAISPSAFADPVSVEQAATAVQRWLARGPSRMGEDAKGYSHIEMYSETGRTASSGQALYYAAYLKPSGIVFLPADDLVEPIVAFQPQAVTYNHNLESPFHALAINSIIAQVKDIRTNYARRSSPSSSGSQAKWRQLTQPTYARGAMGDENSDVRVAPLLKTTWWQGSLDDKYLFNYYTPNHYPSGCVNTAAGQVLRYFQHPQTGIGVKSFNFLVDSEPQNGTTLGGDGSGGPYNWAQMPEKPDAATITEEQRQHIGRLMHDIGISSGAVYTPTGTGTYHDGLTESLVETFQYSNASYFNFLAAELLELIYHMPTIINSNLDAGLPVILGVYRTGNDAYSGHSIVADGYGYDQQTLYHHINLGWGGYLNAWYNLPTVISYNTLTDAVHNIYKTGSGEIISGRVLGSDMAPIAGASVTLSGEKSMTTTTNDKGIFAFYGVPSRSNNTVTASKTGYSFTPLSVTTGKSEKMERPYKYEAIFLSVGKTFIGNQWGVLFVDDTNQGGISGNLTATLTPKASEIIANNPMIYDVAFSGSVKGAFVDITKPDGYHTTFEISTSGNSGIFTTTALPEGGYNFSIKMIGTDDNISVSETDVEVLPIPPIMAVIPQFFTTSTARKYEFTLSPSLSNAQVLRISTKGPGITKEVGYIVDDNGYVIHNVTMDGATATINFKFPQNAVYEMVFTIQTQAGNRFSEIHQIKAETPLTVTFNSQGGGSVQSLDYLVTGSKITKPADPAKSGYTFGGWYKEATCVNAWNFESDTVTGNTTLYAKWTANSTPTNPDDPLDPTNPDDPGTPSNPYTPYTPVTPTYPSDYSGSGGGGGGCNTGFGIALFALAACVVTRKKK
jgi:uncharacterized repeat protein (TIGR02543 family)